MFKLFKITKLYVSINFIYLKLESYDVMENGNTNCQRHGILTNGILSINING